MFFIIGCDTQTYVVAQAFFFSEKQTADSFDSCLLHEKFHLFPLQRTSNLCFSQDPIWHIL